MRKICEKIAIILSLLLMLYSPIQVFGLSKDKDIAREAHYAIAFDTESREILYEKKAFDNVLCGQLTFDINPYSYEQYFFLYVAPKLFKTSTKGWKTVKKFGTEYEYITKYLQ